MISGFLSSSIVIRFVSPFFLIFWQFSFRH
jgi:hypothetical protein